MPFFGRLKAERARARGAEAYVATLLDEPAPDDVAWLAGVGDHDADHAAWELRYLRRGLGLLVAERDALEDATGSAVAAALAAALRVDPHVASDKRAIAERQFNERLARYRETMRERGGGLGGPVRIGHVVLEFAGAPPKAIVANGAEAAALVERELDRLAEQLERSFPKPDLSLLKPQA
jgi:hypothetical protein